MRLARMLLTGGLTAIIVLLPGTASAADRHMDRHIGLHEMNCTGITAMGEGLAANATFKLALVDQRRGATLARESVKSDADGMFTRRLDAKLYDVLSVRLTVAGHDGKTVGFADHTMARGAPMCNLPFTGPSHDVALLVAGVGLLGVGLILLRLGGRGRARRADATA
jgi:hypothetical protein